VKQIPLTSLLICLIAGCGSDDAQLVQMAREHAAQQAAQNEKMAELQKSVADGSKRLVEAEAESRDKLLAMQDNLRADQATVGEQRDKLEGERREIAQQRIRDPIIAEAIVQVGLYLACLLPLVLAGYLVYSMRHTASQDDAAVTEFLVTDIVAEHPLLLGPPTQKALLPKAEQVEAESAAT
jgi:small-conductance mechanosensitive channel